MFFVQAKAARTHFKVLQKLRAAAAGFTDSLILKKKKKTTKWLVCRGG
jgi:hypothetical protein